MAQIRMVLDRKIEPLVVAARVGVNTHVKAELAG